MFLIIWPQMNWADFDRESCTVFTASVDDTVLFGNNEDVGDKNATICFLPATEEIKMQQSVFYLPQRKGMDWYISRFRIILFGMVIFPWVV